MSLQVPAEESQRLSRMVDEVEQLYLEKIGELRWLLPSCRGLVPITQGNEANSVQYTSVSPPYCFGTAVLSALDQQSVTATPSKPSRSSTSA